MEAHNLSRTWPASRRAAAHRSRHTTAHARGAGRGVELAWRAVAAEATHAQRYRVSRGPTKGRRASSLSRRARMSTAYIDSSCIVAAAFGESGAKPMLARRRLLASGHRPVPVTRSVRAHVSHARSGAASRRESAGISDVSDSRTSRSLAAHVRTEAEVRG